MNLEEVRKIDLIVCGSVAVNRKGARVGKGGGYSDLEFALLTEEKKIGRDTPIITSVHPLQIVNESIPMTDHDIPAERNRNPQRDHRDRLTADETERNLLGHATAG